MRNHDVNQFWQAFIINTILSSISQSNLSVEKLMLLLLLPIFGLFFIYIWNTFTLHSYRYCHRKKDSFIENKQKLIILYNDTIYYQESLNLNW